MSLTADIHGIIMEMLALPSTFGIPVTSALGNAAASSMSVGALERTHLHSLYCSLCIVVDRFSNKRASCRSIFNTIINRRTANAEL